MVRSGSPSGHSKYGGSLEQQPQAEDCYWYLTLLNCRLLVHFADVGSLGEDGMDMEEETAKFKWLLIVAVAMLISGCYSYSELKYLAFSKEVDGTVRRSYTQEERARRFRTREVLIVEYAYKDEGGSLKTAKERFTNTSQAPADGTRVKLEYLAGDDDSVRLSGNRKWGAVLIFLACLAGTGWFVVKTWREGTADTRTKAAAPSYSGRRR